mmetsp:Transcript_30002/g.69197  ORF Transcript_30002/g.69197 Transcript_30002/m.69197 type:complete len:298 (+) Transcript_30002:46-939(+)
MDKLAGMFVVFVVLYTKKLDSWIKFTAATGFVLVACSYLWFLPAGPHWGNVFLETLQDVLGTTRPDVIVSGMLSVFAVAHSGLAGLRPYAENIVGARAWRVLFAVVSLPLALSCISYFVNHAHEGIVLWETPYDNEVLHALFWITNFVSFWFLYPSTFNLLEIAAIERPQLHLWETGIIRITRHPQAIGQILWCAAHLAWLGTSTALSACVLLTLHHIYGTWHGDRRLRDKHGEAFEEVKARTSIIPFQAIWEGRQVLPENYHEEFLRGPYLLIVGGTIGAYFCHPYFQAGATLLGW